MAYLDKVFTGNDGEPYVFADEFFEAEMVYLRHVVSTMLEDVDDEDEEDVERVKDELKRLEIEVYDLVGQEREDAKNAILYDYDKWGEQEKNLRLFRCVALLK